MADRERISRINRLRIQYITKLKAKGMVAEADTNGNISISLTGLGLDQVYAEITKDELEYHLDNDDLYSYLVSMVNPAGEVVDSVVIEEKGPEEAIWHATQHYWTSDKLVSEDFDNCHPHVKQYVPSPRTVEEALDQVMEEEG